MSANICSRPGSRGHRFDPLNPFVFARVRASFCHPCGTEKRKCAFVQNRLARCPLTPWRASHGPSGPGNGLRSQLGSHGSYMNACVQAETNGDWPVCHAVGSLRCPATIGRYVGEAHGGRGPMGNAFSSFVLKLFLSSPPLNE